MGGLLMLLRTYSSWDVSCSCSTRPQQARAGHTGHSRSDPPWPSGSRSEGKSVRGEKNPTAEFPGVDNWATRPRALCATPFLLHAHKVGAAAATGSRP